MAQINKRRLPVLLDDCPTLFKALCEPNRLAMLVALLSARRACTVSELARVCPIDLSVASRHLAVLRRAGILQSTKRGREVFYSASASELAATLRGIADALERCCGDGR